MARIQPSKPRSGYLLLSMLFWTMLVGQPCTQALAHQGVAGEHTHSHASETPTDEHRHDHSRMAAGDADCQCWHEACCDEARVWHEGIDSIQSDTLDPHKVFPLLLLWLGTSLLIAKRMRYPFHFRTIAPYPSPPAFKFFCSYLN